MKVLKFAFVMRRVSSIASHVICLSRGLALSSVLERRDALEKDFDKSNGVDRARDIETRKEVIGLLVKKR